MTAGETVGAVIAATVGVILIAFWAFDLWHKPRTRRRFQRTATDAARDATSTQAAADLDTCLAIWNTTPHDIPHQRQPRKDQP